MGVNTKMKQNLSLSSQSMETTNLILIKKSDIANWPRKKRGKKSFKRGNTKRMDALNGKIAGFIVFIQVK